MNTPEAYKKQGFVVIRNLVDAKEAARDRMIIIISSILVAIATSLIWYRIRQLRLKYKTILEQKEAEKLKVKYEKQLLEEEQEGIS